MIAIQSNIKKKKKKRTTLIKVKTRNFSSFSLYEILYYLRKHRLYNLRKQKIFLTYRCSECSFFLQHHILQLAELESAVLYCLDFVTVL